MEILFINITVSYKSFRKMKKNRKNKIKNREIFFMWTALT